MKQIPQDEIEIVISNSLKPLAISNTRFPLNFLDDRLFEILTYSVFKERLIYEGALKKKYDSVTLMQGVGEKGIDCFLSKRNKISSVIQCKRYKTNISDKQFLTELVKFTLHFILEPELFVAPNKFLYQFSTSTGYTNKTCLLPDIIKSDLFERDYDLHEIARTVISKYREFKFLTYEEIEESLIKTIKSFNYKLIRPEDYDLWINDSPSIIESFFDVRKVTDNELILEKTTEIIQTINDFFESNGGDMLDSFVENYKKVAVEKLNNINFIGFDIQKYRQRPESIRLMDLFVQPNFKQIASEKNEKAYYNGEKELKITNVFKTEKNIILLGDPGAGKSLLVKYLMISILRMQADRIGLRQFAAFLPIRIELRKYNEVKESKGIVEYLADLFDKEYQTRISLKGLTALIENIPILVFFDGLDEIFNPTHKLKIKENIEAFLVRYTNVRCVVTSRFIGYHDIKFNSDYFDEFAIQRFNQKQIVELVQKFYATQHSNTEKRNGLIELCLKQINEDIDENLKTNPLILTLILILASNNIIIPDSKLEIYEACTKTLVDSLDSKDKDLRIELPVKNKFLTFSHLAYWQYESISKNHDISYAKAVKTLADFLLGRSECADFSEAESKAEKFIEYAEKRSIYFENNFTHKTFLEYFTAEYLYSTCIAKASDEGRKRLIGIIGKYLSSSFWYIVFELLFTRIDRVQPDNELMDDLFHKQMDSNSLDVFYFFIGNLSKFDNISESIKRQIISKTILLCVRGEKRKKQSKNLLFEESSIIHKINALRGNDTLRPILQAVILDLENDGLNEKEQIELYNLFYEIIFAAPHISLPRIEIKDIKRLRQLAQKDLLLFSNYYLGNRRSAKVNVEILISQMANFGTQTLFNTIPFRHSEFRRKLDTLDFYLLSVIDFASIEEFSDDISKLIDNGLKPSLIVDHIKMRKLLYYTRSENLYKILDLYVKSNSTVLDQILEAIVSVSNKEQKMAYERYRSTNSSSKLKRIDTLFK